MKAASLEPKSGGQEMAKDFRLRPGREVGQQGRPLPRGQYCLIELTRCQMALVVRDKANTQMNTGKS